MAQLHFTEEDWQRVERDTMAWWEGTLDRPLVYLAVTEPLPRSKPYSFLTNYPRDMSAEAVVDLYEPFLDATHFYGDAFPWLWINFGPGMVAGFLGARVNGVTEPSETVWFSPPTEAPIQELELRYSPENPWWLRVQAITAAFAARYGGQLQVSQADLGGNLDILASFRDTQGLLVDVIEQPEEVLRLVHTSRALVAVP